MKQRILLLNLLLLTLIPKGFAQKEKPVTFRFTAHSNMFMLHGNQTELERLCNFVEQHRTEITNGQMPVRVDGYCASFDNRRDNLRTAFIRANRVKSELIVSKGLKEEHFITANHTETYEGEKDMVVVSFMVKEVKIAEQPKPEQKPQQQPERKPTIPPQPVEERQSEPEQQTIPPVISEADYGNFSLRTNLLYWAFATLNLGVEWKPSNSFGILVNGAWSHWIWSHKGKHHRTWLIQPEVRRYLGKSKHWFVGIEGHAGEFNFRFNNTGYQGNAFGGGMTGGYRLQLSKCFDLDFSLGLGYTRLKYESYYRSNDVMVRKEDGLKKDVFAPTQAGVSLIWKIK